MFSLELFYFEILTLYVNTSLKFVPLIPHNKWNTKNAKKIIKTYKTRIKIEHAFGSLKNNKKIIWNFSEFCVYTFYKSTPIYVKT